MESMVRTSAIAAARMVLKQSRPQRPKHYASRRPLGGGRTGWARAAPSRRAATTIVQTAIRLRRGPSTTVHSAMGTSLQIHRQAHHRRHHHHHHRRLALSLGRTSAIARVRMVIKRSPPQLPKNCARRRLAGGLRTGWARAAPSRRARATIASTTTRIRRGPATTAHCVMGTSSRHRQAHHPRHHCRTLRRRLHCHHLQRLWLRHPGCLHRHWLHPCHLRGSS